MPSSSKKNDYDVEKIISKRTDDKGRVFYFIKWKGYSIADNTWEPEDNVTNCSDLIKIFEDERAKKAKPNSPTSEARSGTRSTRSSLLPSKNSSNQNGRTSRSSLPTRQDRKRTSNNNDSDVTDDEDENDKDYGTKTSFRISSSKRSRKSTSDTETTPSIDSHEGDILDTNKVDQILDVRRDKKAKTIEYHIQLKKNKKSVWVKSNRLTEDYSQQIVDFLEDKYV